MSKKSIKFLMIATMLSSGISIFAEVAHDAMGEDENKSLVKEIKVENLHLYKLLDQVKTDLTAMLPILDKSQDQKMARATRLFLIDRIQLITEELELLKTIVDGFNQGFHGDHLFYYPEVELKFINACNLHKDTEIADLKPHQLRSLKKKFIAVNRHVKKYCRMHRIKTHDIAFFNNIILFNERLIDNVLDDQYFSFDFSDDVIDFLYHRPLEFIGEHKVVSIAMGVLAAGAFYYYIVKPWWDEYCLYTNYNKVYDMMQLKVARQKGAECGYHAMLNALIKANALSEKQATELLRDRDFHENIINEWTQFIEARRKKDKSDAEEKGFDDKTLKKKKFKMAKGKDWLQVGEIHALIRNEKNLRPVAKALGVDVADLEIPFVVEGLNRPEDITEAFINRVEGFRKHKGKKAENLVLQIPGHYIAVSITPDKDKKHGVYVEIMDSIWHNNTTDDTVELLTDLYAQKNALKKLLKKAAQHQHKRAVVTHLDNAQAMIDNEEELKNPLLAPESALRHLRNALVAAHKNGLMDDKALKRQLAERFRNVRDFGMARRDDHHVIFEDDGGKDIDIDFGACTTVDKLIEALGIEAEAGDADGDDAGAWGID